MAAGHYLSLIIPWQDGASGHGCRHNTGAGTRGRELGRGLVIVGMKEKLNEGKKNEPVQQFTKNKKIIDFS